MKFCLALVLALLTMSSFAQRTPPHYTIDDLGTISINIKDHQSSYYDIHYPNYRIGGGNGPRLQYRDCLILDVAHSDLEVTLEEKQNLASKLQVSYGFNDDMRIELETAVKSDKVVFYMPASRFYVTSLQVRTRDGRLLNDIVKESIPEGRDRQQVPVGLIYVRACRL